MKLLFLNYEYPPLGGGAANATRYLAREFAKRPDLEVHLVTAAMGDAYEKLHVGGSVWVHRIPIGKDGRNVHSQSKKDIVNYTFRAWRFGSKLIADGRKAGRSFDRTIAFFSVPCGVIALWFRWRFGLPYIVSLRGSDVPGYSEKYGKLFYAALSVPIRIVWRNASVVAPCSKGLMELAKKVAPRQRFEIIPNGVDTERFRPDPSRRRADETVITIGATRLTPRKGVRYLVEATAKLAEKYPRLRLTILGEGEEKAALTELVRNLGLGDRVSFTGQVPADETTPYYQEASIFVLPSLNEGMSNAMLEALASGLPIVATVTGGTEELVTDGENGYLVKKASSEDLVLKLDRLLADEALRQRMGEASRRRAETMSWQRVADRFLEHLKASQ